MTTTDLTEIRRRRQATQTLRSALCVPTLPTGAVEAYRVHADDLVGRIVERVCREVSAYASVATPAVRAVVRRAVAAGVEVFLDVLADRPSEARRAFDLFRDLGRLQHDAGQDLDAMRAAHQVATQEAWDEIQARSGALPAEDTTRLVGALFSFQRQLLDQAMFGYVVARGGVATTRADARERLALALLSGDARTTELASEAGWPVPDELVVVTLRPSDGPAAGVTHPDLLVVDREGTTVLIGAEPTTRTALASLDRTASRPVAVSWPVPVADVPHAHRWTLRVLDLVDEGLVAAADDGVVYCADHQNLLWLSADPALSRRASAELLRPLHAAGARHQDALAETLALWLQTRGTAVALAATLGVHVQTVRQRLRHLRSLFGDQLDDPSLVVGLLAALETSGALRRRGRSAS